MVYHKYVQSLLTVWKKFQSLWHSYKWIKTFNHGGAPLSLLRISLWFPISCINCGGQLPHEGTDHWSKFCLLAGELQHFFSLYVVHAVNTHHWVNIVELFINLEFSGFCKAISSFWAFLLCITALSMYMKIFQACMALLWPCFQDLRYIGLYQRIYLWVSLCISTLFSHPEFSYALYEIHRQKRSEVVGWVI